MESIILYGALGWLLLFVILAIVIIVALRLIGR